jgi:hypothetical protein
VSDHDGQATAVSIVVQVRRLGAPWYRALFFGARHVAEITAPMRAQQFIHFCHWMVLHDVPDERGGRRSLPQPVLWFESNYDGDVVRYMDTFARVIPWRMRAAWTPTAGFPGLFPPGPFHQWTADNAYDTTHYWSAYPEATTRDVGRALRVYDASTALPAPDSGVGAAEFARAWGSFLAETQADL